MTEQNFYLIVDDILELDEGTVTSETELSSYSDWDSLAILSFIAAVDTDFQVTVSGQDVVACKTANDLAKLLGNKIES